ncbi:baseplate J/gp47 family protein [Streptomyces sp. NPDC059982]|uniref:baseplate J/gp47 family protein n=1 Tax=unclassified Streptomyces TaxID=2593676 RepID=UPI0036CD8D85
MTYACGCHDACACDPLETAAPRVHNLPRRPALEWRVAPHPDSLSRMRAALAAGDGPSGKTPAPPRCEGDDEAAVALLDSWAYVADVVSFYTERIANEGFLRTATELGSVRELARTLGHELRPGVAATVDLAFTVEDTPGAPGVADVPAGLPVQTVPAAGQLPQTFETSEELRARACWNAIPLTPSVPQKPHWGTTEIWVKAVVTGVRRGDGVLVVGRERLDEPGDERWDFRVVESVTEGADGRTGWTRLRVRPGLGEGGKPKTPLAEHEVEVFTFDERANLFGWNAPEPSLMCPPEGKPAPPGLEGCGASQARWADFGVLAPGSDPSSPARPPTGSTTPTPVIELDGDHPRLTAGGLDNVADASRLVLEQNAFRELYRVEGVQSGGGGRYAMSGRLTRALLDTGENLDRFDRRTALVHCASRPLPARTAPRAEKVTGDTLELMLTDPLLPAGRTVLITGHPDGQSPSGPAATAAPEPPPLSERAVVVSCERKNTPPDVEATMVVKLDHELPAEFDPRSLRVLANVVTATHGETVTEVLGSGDGRMPFPRFRLRLAPLTYVRTTNAGGARAALELRVDGIVWPQTLSLNTMAATDRVHTLRTEEGGGARLVLGDGTHGARPSTGVENITAVYRVGIGAEGAAAAGQLSLLTRRPLGIRSVANPAPARDWAPPESPADARRNAPQRIRTLDRAVSVADHEDLAAGFAGVGKARADGVWDGTSTAVVVSVLGPQGGVPSTGLLTDLRTTLEGARDPGTRLQVVAGEVLLFGLDVDLRHDPAYVRAFVEESVRSALEAAYGPTARGFTEAVTAAGTLVTVRRTPGVLACTMPRLRRLTGTSPATATATVLRAEPARWDPTGSTTLPAQLLAVATGGIRIGEMP